MSINTPDNGAERPNSGFRKAIWIALACAPSTLFAATCSTAPESTQEPQKELDGEQEPKQENYDDGLYYKGIEKGPAKKKKEPKKQKKKDIEDNSNERSSCTSQTCKYA